MGAADRDEPTRCCTRTTGRPASLPLLAAPSRRTQSLAATVFTIHNLAYQGVFDASWLPRLGLGWELMHVEALEFWGRISYLKAGIMFSRMITTVSPRYAAGNPDAGARIRLRRHPAGPRARDLVGILNGIDYDQWDPARDPHLPQPFEASNLEGKAAAKREVLERYGFSRDGRADAPAAGRDDLPAGGPERVRPAGGTWRMSCRGSMPRSCCSGRVSGATRISGWR